MVATMNLLTRVPGTCCRVGIAAFPVLRTAGNTIVSEVAARGILGVRLTFYGSEEVPHEHEQRDSWCIQCRLGGVCSARPRTHAGRHEASFPSRRPGFERAGAAIG